MVKPTSFPPAGTCRTIRVEEQRCKRKAFYAKCQGGLYLVGRYADVRCLLSSVGQSTRLVNGRSSVRARQEARWRRIMSAESADLPPRMLAWGPSPQTPTVRLSARCVRSGRPTACAQAVRAASPTWGRAPRPPRCGCRLAACALAVRLRALRPSEQRLQPG